jgi:hypothetical protein
MSVKLRNAIALAVVLLAFVAGGCGLTAPRSSDGYADLDSLGFVDTDHVLSLSIGPALMNFAANHVDDDPETQALLRSLDGVRLRIYEIDGDAGRVAGRLESMSAKLQRDGWEAVMTVRNRNEQVHVLMRMADTRISGLTVLVSDGEAEAVLVNVMGDIRPEQFNEVMVALDVEAAGVQDVDLEDRPTG